MNQPTKTLSAFLLMMMLLGTQFSSVLAFPPLPSSFYGEVKFNDENVPNGTLVEALIEGKVIAESLTETYQGRSVYTIDIPGDDPGTKHVEGGSPGQTIIFRVGGQEAEQTGLWQSGTNINLDLSATSKEKILPPLPTRTPLPTQTAITYESQSTPAFTQTAVVSSLMADDEPTNAKTRQANEVQTGSEPSEVEQTKIALLTDEEGTSQSSTSSFSAGLDFFKAAVNDENSPKINQLLWIFIPALLLVGSGVGYWKIKKNHGHNIKDQDLL